MNAFPLLPCGEQCAARTGPSGGAARRFCGAAHHLGAARPDPTNMKKSPKIRNKYLRNKYLLQLVMGIKKR